MIAMNHDTSITGFHLILLHKITFDGKLYIYCRFVVCGSEQISLNCIHVLPNTRSIPMMNT